MTNRKKSTQKKNSNTKKEKRIGRSWNIYKYMLIALQALFGALIGVCFFVFNEYSTLYLIEDSELVKYSPSIFELRQDYYNSVYYQNTLNTSVDELLRFVAIREQMENGGVFSEDKKINVGEYATRRSQETYEGPVVEYYLGDLIKWGQKGVGNLELFCSYEFYTAKEYCEFFSLNLEEYVLGDEYIPNPDPGDTEYFDYVEEKVAEAKDRNVASFETLKNQFLTAEGKTLENYVDNVEDYSMLVSYVQKSAADIYANYLEYLKYEEFFDSDNTNLRYAVTMTINGRRTIFTNDSKVTKWSSDSKIDDIFKSYSKYMYAAPSKLVFDTNTLIEYSLIKDGVIDRYEYAYPDDTAIWVSLDTNFPADDVFKKNFDSLGKATKVIPWIVFSGALSLAVFLVLFVVIITKERKYYSKGKWVLELSYFDRLPIEIVLVSFVLLILVLYIGESLFIGQIEKSDTGLLNVYSYFSIGFFIFDLYIALMFFYALARRIISGSFFEGSIASAVSPGFKKLGGKIRALVNKMSDNGSETFKVWGLYISFLLFNVFWGAMFLFGTMPIVSFIVLIVFDIWVGVALFNRSLERKRVLEGINIINTGDYTYKYDLNKLHGENRELAMAINEIGMGLEKAVEISTKDEKLKADLITNVSHDIKTPLTSIINYVDLLKRENIEDEKVKKYISVLDEKSQRLKQLTFDLVEASKITSGNISIELVRLNMNEFVKQAVGEFEERFEKEELDLVLDLPKEAPYIMADPRHLWRVLENILNNVCKYALKKTRVYLDVTKVAENDKTLVVLSLKNISSQKLNIPAEELTERFIRGDVSRSTEGSGLGLSIAKSLTTVQQGDFQIYLDGDLFKITISFEEA